MSQQIPNPEVTVQQAHERQQNGANLIDVRTPAETAEGYPAGAKCIPLDELPSRINELKAQDEIYCICRSGRRSEQAVEFLAGQGFTNVSNVIGGYMEWSQQNLPTA